MAESKEKEFKVRTSRRMGSMKEVYIEGGGEVPADLKGFYTDAHSAQKQIDLYLATRRSRPGRQKAD